MIILLEIDAEIFSFHVQAKRAASRKVVLHTDFLTPPVMKESMNALDKLADIKAIAQGGYPQVGFISFALLSFSCKEKIYILYPNC